MATKIAAAKKSLRILALPLVSASKTPGVALSGHLTYYHFATPPPHPEKKKNWVNWATDKASGLWEGFGKAKEGSWQVNKLLFYLVSRACRPTATAGARAAGVRVPLPLLFIMS
jgi:hypothetical protein